MAIIKSSSDHLTINADGASKDIKFQANGVEKASISSAGAFTSTSIDATKLTGNLPAISGASLTNLPSKGKNLIINGDFQVSQRGSYTSNTTTSAAYYVDRWKSGGVSTLLHTKDTAVSGLTPRVNTLKMTVPSGQAAAALQQFFEHINQLKGVQVTLSCWMKSDIGSSINLYDGSSQTHSSAHTGGGGWEKITVTATIGASASQVRAEAYTGGSVAVGSYFELAQVQLELGSTATDFEHRSYGEELALCQRYYEPFGNGWTARGESSTSTVFFGRFKVSKRTDPTIGVLTTNMRMFEWGVADRDASTVAVNVNQIHENGGHIKCGGFPSTSTGNLYGLGNNSSTSDGEPFSADAEL
jgi:hypothetical protein